MSRSVKLEDALLHLADHWSPKVVGQVNDHFVKVAKLLGTLAWHKHDDQDELFLVLRGNLVIELEGDAEVAVGPGEFYVVPRGVLHNPVANEECWVVLVEPVSTEHTGGVVTERTRSIAEQLAP